MRRSLPPLALLVLGACASVVARPEGNEQSRLALAASPSRLPVGGGRIAVVVYFATWAEGAKSLLPSLDELRRRLPGDEVTVTGVAIDEDQRFVAPFLRELGVELPVIADPGARETQPGLQRVPTVLVFDGAGKVRARFEGASSATAPQIEREIESLRANGGPPG